MKHPRRSLTLAATLLLIATSSLAAQRSSQQGSQQGKQSPRQSGERQDSRDGKGQGSQIGGQQGDRAQSQQRVQVDQATRQYARDCHSAASNARQAAGSLVRGKELDRGDVIRQKDRLRTETEVMLRQHDSFMRGLGTSEREALQSYTRSLDKTRARLESGLSDLDRLLERKQVDPRKVANQARKVDRQLEKWQKTYQHLERDLGVG